ncbi:MAG: ribosome maturation factor RimM [Micavibrio sp.]|nr:ribosome maturation factor RimM [Micavibrio sp.]
MSTDKKILIGKIASAHGVKGLVKILPYCDDVYLLEEVESHAISLKNALGKYILAEVEGISDKTAADALRGTELHIERSALPPADDGEFYYEDLIGLKAVNQKTGSDAGLIKAVLNFGAGDLLEIRANNGSEYLVPFTDENVPSVDIESGVVHILPLEGL